MRLDADHCANQQDPTRYCDEKHGMAFCSSCRSESNGCRPDRPDTDCDAGESAADTSNATTTTGMTTDVSMSASMSSTTVDPTTTTQPTTTMSTTESMDSSTGDPLPGCGNGIVEMSLMENCDPPDMPQMSCADVALPGGMLGCYGPDEGALACRYDLSECQNTQQCGNGDIQGDEQCDDDNLNMQTCESISDDYIGGTLSCNPDGAANPCTFDTSACTPCIMDGELCANTAECCGSSICLLDHCAL